MRRWQAIPVAAIVALAVGAIMFTHAPGAQAGTATPVEFYLDCAPGGGIDAACVLPSGTTSVDVDVVLKNNTGAAIGLSALNVSLQTDNQPVFAPTTPACVAPALNCNPDFNDAIPGGFNCGSPLPSPDQNASATIAESNIGCFTGAVISGTVADGASLVLATVHYSVVADGFGAFQLQNTAGGQGGLATDENNFELGSCNPEVAIIANCFGATIQVGASGATNTPVGTATNTPPPTATPTPCVSNCPTPTSVAFVTVTPTPCGSNCPTPTAGAATAPAGGETPAAPGEQPGVAPVGEQPGGDTGAGGARPIRLPDTGSRSGGNDGSLMLAVLATLGGGVLAGGLYFGAAVAAGKRREGDD